MQYGRKNDNAIAFMDLTKSHGHWVSSNFTIDKSRLFKQSQLLPRWFTQSSLRLQPQSARPGHGLRRGGLAQRADVDRESKYRCGDVHSSLMHCVDLTL